jgi:hypothetical protein
VLPITLERRFLDTLPPDFDVKTPDLPSHPA